MDRRKLIKTSVISIGTAATILKGATPSQPEGPFHPINIDNDLRRLNDSAPFAEGEQIEIVGTLQRSDTKEPIRGVFIEIWQADKNGKYSHPNDPLPIEPDPNFQFFGRAYTDAQGRYSFRTIKPGPYPAGDDWIRPPHIHLHFSRRGYHDLTTQLYFHGEPLNEKDRLLNTVPPQDRSKLIVHLKSGSLKRGIFNVELDPV